MKDRNIIRIDDKQFEGDALKFEQFLNEIDSRTTGEALNTLSRYFSC
jgi:hypothetical protein